MSNTKLNQLDQAWVDALRSGNHKQGIDGYLCKIVSGEMHECCLGVLLNIREDPDVTIDKTSTIWEYKDKNTRVCAALSSRNCENYGFFSIVGGFRDRWVFSERRWESLAGLNDNGYSFIQIADFIEAFPWVVFRHYDEPDGAEFDLPVSFGGGKLVKIV
jgi:hypothetical protein